MTLKLDNVPSKLIDEFGVIAKYYPAHLCSCMAENHGAFDPTCGCYGGFRYGNGVEYRLIRTSIRYDKITERAGQILQGGCMLTIPKWLQRNNAQITGKKNISEGVNLSDDYMLLIAADDNEPVPIDCRDGASNPSNVKIQDIIDNINAVLQGGYAFETAANGDIGQGYITIRSQSAGENSRLRILKPAENDATYNILGLGEHEYPYMFNWNNSGIIYLPVYHSLAIGDVFVLKSRLFRDSAICQKAVNDVIKAFDIDNVVMVSKRDIIYRRGIDYDISGNTITWLEDGNAPDDGEFYTVEYSLPMQYVVYNDMGSDRGGDNDQPAKKVMAAFRNYINAQSLTIDHLGD